ncbi:hypothetical protein SA496_15170 [Pseudomonas sp. JS3066]|uniref:hypothetical protein n=1 Tax=Pseudomonas sp. JS3066 TaxID=3090665 RepID=UPI002E7B2D79|nr:hypothetical protein [Pseudomonas sp. JS3066]WVK91079.1 hypothetical protein SA496_15170 [Pseudomonas sp. JS3066]
MLKTFGLALATLLAVVAIALWTLLGQLEPSIKSAIETEGALATQTQVLVGRAELSPFTGMGALDGLTVGNPTGFAPPYAIVVDRIALQVERGSLLGGGPIIVDSATVIAPQITYMARSPTATSNLETIKNTARNYSATPAAIRASSHARKVIIRELTVMGGSISLDVQLPGGALTVPLPPLHLANVGVATNGATPPAIIRAVSEALADEAKKAVTAAIARKVKSAVDMIKTPARGLPKSMPLPPFPPPLPSMPTPPSRPSLPSASTPPSPPSLPTLPSPPSLPPPPPGLKLLPPPPGF